MKIQDTVQFNKVIYLLGEDSNLYLYYWNFQKANPEYELRLISNSATNSHQPGRIISLYADNRNLYALGDNGCIFKFVDGKYNLSKVNWVLDKASEFAESNSVSIKQMITNESVLGSDSKVYEWSWFKGKHSWVAKSKPASYLVDSLM